MSLLDKQIQTRNWINLNCQDIRDVGLKHLCEIDAVHIEKMFLGCNGITADGIYHFSKAKMGNLTRNITYLFLFTNHISNFGCKYLSQTELPNLTVLNIGKALFDEVKNQIGREGVLHISKSQWRKLQDLDLSENKFKDEAMFWMGKCLWPSIKSIGLRKLNDKSGENGLSCEGVKMLMLVDAIKSNRFTLKDQQSRQRKSRNAKPSCKRS